MRTLKTFVGLVKEPLGSVRPRAWLASLAPLVEDQRLV